MEVNAHLAAVSLRDFLVQRYVNVASFGDARYWNIQTADYSVAFDAIQYLSPNRLEQNQRSQLANLILRILLQANTPDLVQVCAHFTTLTKLVTTSKGSMNILSNIIEKSPKDSKNKEPELTLIALARRIDESFKWSQDNIVAVGVVQRLIHEVMRYVKPSNGRL